MLVQRVRGARSSGAAPDLRRMARMEEFGLYYANPKRLPQKLLDLLDACKDDDARRILLGVSGRTVG